MSNTRTRLYSLSNQDRVGNTWHELAEVFRFFVINQAYASKKKEIISDMWKKEGKNIEYLTSLLNSGTPKADLAMKSGLTPDKIELLWPCIQARKQAEFLK